MVKRAASILDLVKRLGAIATAIISTAIVLGWVYTHTAGPIVNETKSNTLALASVTAAQSNIVTRLEQMEKRQDDFDTWRRTRRSR